MEFNNANFLHETQVPYDELIVSRTDLDGIITYANDTFAYISGYTKDELIGQSHNIVRHPDMPKVCFNELWSTIKEEKKWIGNVKNLRKDGGYYWVKATVSGVYKDGTLVEYKSIRVPIEDEEKLKTLKKYDELKIQSNDKQRHIIYK
jgi:aerotaxis receptor